MEGNLSRSDKYWGMIERGVEQGLERPTTLIPVKYPCS